MAFEIPLYKGKRERTEFSNFKGFSLLTVVGKINAGILVVRVRKVTEGLIDDKQGGFRTGKGCVDQIFILKQIGEKAREKKRSGLRVLWTRRRPMIGSIGRH